MLNIPCYVVDGTFYGELRAWVRVYIDGVWYNTDVYGDKTAISLVKTAGIYKEDDGCFHTYFLTNDTYIGKHGYTPNEEYEVFWNEIFSADSSKDNFYIERDRTYIDSSADLAYHSIVGTVAGVDYSGYGSGQRIEFPFLVAPFLVDELVDKLNESLFYDLKEKYSLEPTDATIKYRPDKFILTIIV